jgi:outer membrane lipoprotein-sorting protein
MNMKLFLGLLLASCAATCGCAADADRSQEERPVAPAPAPGPEPVPADGNVAEPAPRPEPAPVPEPVPAREETAPAAGAGETPIAAEDLRKLLADWCEGQKKLKTIVTRFKCSETSPMLVRPQVTHGLIQIKKPDGYRRTVFQKPDGDAGPDGEVAGLMILKPPKLWVYLPAARRAEEFDLTKVGGRAGDNPLRSLGDIISFDETRISRSFRISAFSLESGGCRLDYVPLEGRVIGGVKQVRVWMKPEARFPLRMETASGDGDLRTEEYSDSRFDEELPDDLFAFKRPRGVELIKVAP